MKTYKIDTYKVRLVVEDSIQVSREKVECSEHAHEFFAPVLVGLPHEEVWLLGLNGKKRPLGLVRVSMGGACGAALTVQDILRPVIAMGAAAFLLAHNHPSGDPKPSQADLDTTKAVTLGAELLGVLLLDHLVLAGERYASIREYQS
jgi:DNA repair protein RadC